MICSPRPVVSGHYVYCYVYLADAFGNPQTGDVGRDDFTVRVRIHILVLGIDSVAAHVGDFF